MDTIKITIELPLNGPGGAKSASYDHDEMFDKVRELNRKMVEDGYVPTDEEFDLLRKTGYIKY